MTFSNYILKCSLYIIFQKEERQERAVTILVLSYFYKHLKGEDDRLERGKFTIKACNTPKPVNIIVRFRLHLSLVYDDV